MDKKRWDEILVNDHEMIERAMDVLKKELEKLPDRSPDLFSLKRTIDFLLEFGDRIHNKKEEDWLFPLLIKSGIPEDGPIRVMLGEHEYERSLLDQMSGDTDSLPGMALEAKEVFKKNGLEYLDIRANHIWKENDVLYAMGRKAFSEADNTYLVKAFDDFSAGVYGNDYEQKISAMLHELEGGKAARTSLLTNLSYDQIDAIMETLPFEVTFVDAQDSVAYFNRLDKEKLFVRSRSVIGRKVVKCHPGKSVDKVEQIVNGFKSGELDKAEFWIDLGGKKILIRYFPVRDQQGEYLGVLEVTQEISEIQKLTGEKRLLDL
ncbi:MAG: hypothetical protein DRH90_08660 [Deltaproteobacteria bacterium]|nr:MAG: hypothetical protein DRH90_08660 [Deltaproteobacteria bacterium]RLC10895.1 MAG: hypothetical protein DRI24_19600 [Deltaproteobacteria bacterium]